MAWLAADTILICGVEYSISLAPFSSSFPGPVLTLTQSGTAGSSFSLFAVCWGDGWAEFVGPGWLAKAVCTGTVITDCVGRNLFRFRVDCKCAGSNYNGPGWYAWFDSASSEVRAVSVTTTTGGGFLALVSGESVVRVLPCGTVFCPGGPYESPTVALENQCFKTLPAGCLDERVWHIPNELEIELFDAVSFFPGTVDVSPLNGLVFPITFGGGSWQGPVLEGYVGNAAPPTCTVNVPGLATTGGACPSTTGCVDIQAAWLVSCVSDLWSARLSIQGSVSGGIVVIGSSQGWFGSNWTALPDPSQGDGFDFEMVFTDLFVGSGGSVGDCQRGSISAIVRRRTS